MFCNICIYSTVYISVKLFQRICFQKGKKVILECMGPSPVPDAGMPMPAASASMPMPSYAKKYGSSSRGKLHFTFSSKLRRKAWNFAVE
jgi:hypothetical protein